MHVAGSTRVRVAGILGSDIRVHISGTARARSARSASATHQPLVKSARYRLLRFVIPNRSKIEQLIGR